MPPPEPTPPDVPTQPAPSRAGRAVAAVEWLALGLAIACGLAAWRVGVRSGGYDYDEVTRAHSTWLAAQGLRPYEDFFEVHPPYFRLIAPVVRDWSDPLPTLRRFAAVGNLLFLGGLGAIAARLAPDARRWAILGVAAVAFHPAVLSFLVEFRIDGWGYALASWSIYRHLRPGSGASRDFELGALTGVATLLFCPKLTILPACIALFGQFRRGATARRAALGLGAYAAGVGVACLVGLGFLATQGIGLGRLSSLLVRYHAVSGANANFRRGLLAAILANRLLLGLVLAGAAGSAVACLRRRSRPSGVGVALAIWLAAQAAAVAYPYKQYFAPWFLFGAVGLGSLGRGASARLAWARLPAFLALAVVTGLGSVGMARLWARLDEAAAQAWTIRWMREVAAPGDRVVASPPLHPVDRRDTFFVWFNTSDPGGFDAERILERIPDFRAAVAPARFRAELEANPPALVLLEGDRMVGYPAGQWRALREFLARRGYRALDAGLGRFAVRPDRLERARQGAGPPRY